MIINNKKKISTDQNLIPASLLSKRLLNMSLVPGLIAIISIVLIATVIRYGVPAITKSIDNKTAEITAKSLTDDIASLKDNLVKLEDEKAGLQNEYDNYYINNPLNVEVNDSILQELEGQIKDLEAELRLLQNGANADVDVLEKYRVHELVSYLDKVRSENITIISLEDLKTLGYAGSDQLVYENDVGETSFSLHGLATDPNALSEFLLQLKKCDVIKEAKTLSIETHTVNEEQNIYVFEVSITPNILTEVVEDAE